MELITPGTAKIFAYYDHPVWGKYAAVTENNYGNGLATYIGCMTSKEVLQKILEDAVKKAGLWGLDQQIMFPLITKSGLNQMGKTIHYYLNYSADTQVFNYPFNDAKELLSGDVVTKNKQVQLKPWGIKIVEEQ